MLGEGNAEARCQPEEDLVSGKISQLSDNLSDHLAGETLAVGVGAMGGESRRWWEPPPLVVEQDHTLSRTA